MTSRGDVTVIDADDRDSAAYALGRAVARDRAFQLDLHRRKARGRLAELFGPSALEWDIAQRTLGIERAARRMIDCLPRHQHNALVSHAQGIDDGLRELPALPEEYRILAAEPTPWTAVDSAAVALLLAQMLGGDGAEARTRDVMTACLPPELCAFLLPRDGPYATDLDGSPVSPQGLTVDLAAVLRSSRGPTPGSVPVVGADQSPFGSNAFAVAAHRSGHGGAILANDMHLPLTAPTLFYRVSLRYPGHRLDGVVVPGLPVVVAGASNRLAWGATRLTASNVEVIELRTPEHEPTCYQTADGAEPFQVRQETVLVRGSEPVEVTVRETRWGPVHGTHRGYPTALRWRPLEDGGLDLGLLDVTECADVHSACRTAARAAPPPMNLVLADADGRVAWTVTGSFPRRSRPSTVVRPHLGDSSWSSLLTPDELPRLVDPAGGIVVVANNVTVRHRDLADNGFSARRARRASELLAKATRHTEADLLVLQHDVDATFFVPYRDLAREVATGDVLAVVDRWDGTAAPGAIGLGLLMLFRENLRETLFAAVLAPCRERDPAFRYAWHDHEAPLRALLGALADDAVPAPYRSRHEFLRVHLSLAAVMHQQAVGPLAAPWGELNRSAIRHPLSALSPDLAALFDLPDVALPGCAESVNAAHPGFGPAMRLVASPTRPEAAVLQLPGGQSGDPRQARYRNQFSTWLRPAAAPSPEVPS